MQPVLPTAHDIDLETRDRALTDAEIGVTRQETPSVDGCGDYVGDRTWIGAGWL